MAAVGELEELPNDHERRGSGEPLESVSMEASEVLEARAGLSVDDPVLSSSSLKKNNNLENDSTSYEKFSQDVDSYWDDVGDRLKVLRMVSDSIIKGMVNAAVEEAAEKSVSKKVELVIFHDKLQSYETDAGKLNRLESLQMMPDLKVTPEKTKSELQNGFLDANIECDFTRCISMLKIAVEEQLRRITDDLKSASGSESSSRVNGCSSDADLGSILPQGNNAEELLKIDERVNAFRLTLSAAFKQINNMFFTLKASICECQWEDEFQRELNTIMIKSYIKDLHDDFEAKLWEKKNLVNTLYENMHKRFDELSAMRQELDAMSKSLCSSEYGLLLSYNTHDPEEWNTGKRKDHITRKALGNHHLLSTSHPEENGPILLEESGDSAKPMLEVAESPQLKGMTKEQVITYYKSEMTKMSRQHDSALQEKTEALFSLKREFLKEKGSSPFRKDKEFEFLRKKISEVLLKLEDILLDSEKLPAVHDNHDLLCGFKDRIDTLYFENQHLRAMLTDKRKEVMCLSSQVSDAASQMSLHSSVEASFLKQIEKLKWNMEDVKIEASIRDALYKDILRDFVGKHQDILRDFLGKHQDILRDFVTKHKSVMVDLEIQTNIMQEVFSIISRGVADDAVAAINPVISKHYMERGTLEALLLEKEKAVCSEIEEQEKLKQAITLLMEEKKSFALETGTTLMQQKEQFDLAQQEVSMLRDKVSKQEVLISDKNMELESVKGRLDDTLQQTNQYKADIDILNQKNRILWDTLEEAEKDNNMLHGIIEDKQNTVSSLITKEKEQGKQMESIVSSVRGLAKAVVDFENRLGEIFGRHEPRLNGLSHQCNQLLQQANLLKKKGLLYKHMLEIKCSNLQKAEAEVDLLGDEVDALLSLLGKIYIALDHYSPVLQHYPGVMEILKLVQRELKGENNNHV